MPRKGNKNNRKQRDPTKGAPLPPPLIYVKERAQNGQARRRPRRAVNDRATVGTINADQSLATRYGTQQMQAMFSTERGRFVDSIKVRGQDFLGPVPFLTGAAVPTGTNLTNILISPSTLAGTRLAAYGQIYEKYLFTRLTFHYVTAVGTGIAGSLVLSYDRDVSDVTPPQSLVGVQQYLATAGAVGFPVWQNASINCPLDFPTDGYYTNVVVGSDERLAYQGQVYLSVMSTLAVIAAGTSYGNLWVSYECEFFVPQLEQSLTQGQLSAPGPVTLPPTDAWAPGITAAAGKLIPTLLQNGKKGFRLSPGVYEIIQSAVGQAASTGSFDAPAFAGLSKPSGQDAQLSNLDNLSLNGATTSTFRRDQLTVLDPLGLMVWGSAATLPAVSAFKATISRIIGGAGFANLL